MPIQYASSELVARAWLQAVTGLPAGSVVTTVPQDQSTWSANGIIQVVTVGGSPTRENSLRRPAFVAHCFAVNPSSMKTNPLTANRASQLPPWGKATDLAETILRACEAENGRTLDLGVTGSPAAHVLQGWALTEPRRVPSKDNDPTAHVVVDFQLAWIEL